ncbi:hypothetical protein LSTR_LSTR015055 [Laodelphax striatellus]|uniref:MADF domain-containing protein n=1 Tax=Laodelphax striatellus TaxID=195883 RepID=A0A482X4V2_LAOST|nr:hypothetical protein LSTR_LSTR015055 [Laodelphax striatellus]
MKEVIIAAVFKREPLWNPFHKHHKNVMILKKLWEEVAEEVNEDEKTVSVMWKNLRTYFYREVRKLEKDGNKSTSSWQYFNQLMFLKDIISESQQDTNILINSIISDTSEAAESTDVIKLERSVSPSPSMFLASSYCESELSHQTKRNTASCYGRQHERLKREKRKLDLLEKRNLQEDNDDLLFFKSLLPYMKKISSTKKLKLRSVIQDAILEQLPTESEES